ATFRFAGAPGRPNTVTALLGADRNRPPPTVASTTKATVSPAETKVTTSDRAPAPALATAAPSPVRRTRYALASGVPGVHQTRTDPSARACAPTPLGAPVLTRGPGDGGPALGAGGL